MLWGGSEIEPQKNVDFVEDNQGQHDEILKYVAENYGKVTQTISEIVPGSRVAVSLHIIPASKDRKYITIFTTGMSDYPMDEAEEAKETAYAELLIKLPADWPLEQKKMKDENNYWPLGWLRKTAHIPHLYDGVLGEEVILPNGEPPEPFAAKTKLSCIMVCKPKEEKMEKFITSKGKIINFYLIMPIYEEERNIALTEGYEYLLEKLNQNRIGDVLDIARKNVGLKTE
ncbi:suppressor of fused domain protein [Anaerosinus massiliensis]|uniref:suppressor of fused domain protein n=1 Tax=Massilibacillus massiliensis TaxID=1806837 RepID=UPI000A81F48F|nr:suppressor of fused domain protein [Massilibacillus massiliensis]